MSIATGRAVPETHLQYAQRVGLPRVVACDIEFWPHGGHVFWCRSHDYHYSDRGKVLDDRLNDRCPMSRLEEWRARAWEHNAA